MNNDNKTQAGLSKDILISKILAFGMELKYQEDGFLNNQSKLALISVCDSLREIIVNEKNSTPTVEAKSLKDIEDEVIKRYGYVPNMPKFVYEQCKKYAQQVTEDLRKENEEQKELIEKMAMKLEQNNIKLDIDL